MLQLDSIFIWFLATILIIL